MKPVEAVVARAREEGCVCLLETEAYALAESLGIGVPAHLVVPVGGPVPGLGGLPGEQVVVKVLSPGVAHKSDRRGVRVVRREAGAVAAAIAGMAAEFAGDEVRGWLVAEFVAHDTRPGSEVLLGLRRTPEFGTVVLLGLGGVHAEWLAPAVPPAVVRLDGGRARFPSASPAVRALTAGVRGAPAAVTLAALQGFLDGLAAALPGLPGEVVDLELNPLVFAPARPVALDALARLGPVAVPAPPRPVSQVGRLLHPRSIAVAGVAERMNPGRVILRNILGAGFPVEAVTVIKPGAGEVDGCRAVPGVAALTERVDLLVLSIGAGAAPAALEGSWPPARRRR